MGRAALEVEKDGLVDRDLVHGGDLVGRLLAGIVGSAGLQRRSVQVGGIEGNGESHLDVGARRAAKGQDEHGADHEEVDHGRGGGGDGSCGGCGGDGENSCWKLLKVVSASELRRLDLLVKCLVKRNRRGVV